MTDYKKVFVDTAPFIYFIEKDANNPQYYDKVKNFIIENTTRIISTIIIICICLLILLIARIITKRFIKRNNGKRKHAVTLAKLLLSICKYVIVILTIVILLSTWGINVAPLLAGAGIVALGISLGAQKIIGDFISGLCIVFENCYDVDDVVEINGFKGRVEEISLRSTKLVNWKNEMRIISNGNINDITNYSKAPSIGSVDITVAYHENIDHVIQVLEEHLGELRDMFPQIIEGPNVIGVVGLNDSSVAIRVNVKTNTEEHYAVERGINKFVKDLFDKEGIEIPFNQLVVHNADNNK